jgi:hypothetical protein
MMSSDLGIEVKVLEFGVQGLGFGSKGFGKGLGFRV